MKFTLRPNLLLMTSAVFLLAGCVSAPDKSPAEQTPPEPALSTSEKSPVSEEVMFKVWAAEVFGSEGEFQKAAEEYLGAALISSDPEIAQRATEVAIAAQSWQIAAMASGRWVALAPSDVEARETAIRTLLVGGDYVEAEQQLIEMLSLLENQPWQGWVRVAPLMTTARNNSRAMELVTNLIAETGAESNPYAIYVQSQIAARGGEFEEALTLINRALAIAPGEAELQSWAGRLALGQRDTETALERYKAAWSLQPSERSLALVYAELLRETGDSDTANDVLASLPDTPENRFTRVAFATSSGLRPLAVSIYQGFNEVPYSDATEKAFQAARSAEVLGFTEDAIQWYAQLDGTDQELIALLRRSYLLAELGRIDEARSILLFARNSGAATVQMETMLVEAQILIEADQSEEAFSVLAKALDQFPDDTRLLYTRALISAELGDVEGAEEDLRIVLAMEPGNAAALNALGYTLADQTDRLAEAEELIQRAYELEPEDAAIIDSMGWVAYRQGRLEEAEQFLRQALLRDRNAEIAAHLGEVLWQQGRQREARIVWSEGQRIDPTDRVLVETLKRFDITL